MLELQIDYKSDIPLNRQIYLQIRDKILAGQLLPGDQLPATREIARYYEMARMTINVAYEQLEVEGYVVTRHGAGTFVSEDIVLPDRNRPSTNRNGNGSEKGGGRSGERSTTFSVWHHRLERLNLLQTGQAGGRTAEEQRRSDVEIDFGFGRSFANAFPFDTWRKLLARYLSTDDALLSRYGSVSGFEPLRVAIAAYVNRQRGVKCRPEQVVIVSGVQQAIDILSRILINPGDEVLVESPGYINVYNIFEAYGANLRGVPVDENGFDPSQTPADTKARLMFVTPSNQFPHGGAMPAARRLELVRWAAEHDAHIIEDDYDGELRYQASPLSAMQGLDHDDRVIYLGSFSKVLLPALRLGYVVLPEYLIGPFTQTKRLMDRGAPTLTQAAIADFINEGHFERHLRNLRKLYAERRSTLMRTIQSFLGDRVTYADHQAGFHVLLYLQEGVNEHQLVKEAYRRGVAVYPGAPYHLETEPKPSILLGFCGLENEEIVAGIERLSQALDLFSDTSEKSMTSDQEVETISL